MWFKPNTLPNLHTSLFSPLLWSFLFSECDLITVLILMIYGERVKDKKWMRTKTLTKILIQSIKIKVTDCHNNTEVRRRQAFFLTLWKQWKAVKIYILKIINLYYYYLWYNPPNLWVLLYWILLVCCEGKHAESQITTCRVPFTCDFKSQLQSHQDGK